MKGYRTKRIALPGGRSIEIVYFYETTADADVAETGEHEPETAPVATAPGADVAPEPEAGSALHVCPDCDGDLVYPVAWEERGEESWRIDRRCPSCEWTDTGDFDQSLVEDFDDILNDGTEALLATLRNFSRANMEEDIERLIDAISSGLIQPMDF